MRATSAVQTAVSIFHSISFLAALLFLGFGVAGCASTSSYSQFEEKAEQTARPDAILLREGDVIRITFPGAPSMNAAHQIRRDGKISLDLVGEVLAAGMTPDELEKQLVKLYSPHLLTKEVTVSLASSSFPVFVTGAVLRPGRINSERPITALEAIMEAGGFDYAKANLKKIKVIRNNKGKAEYFTLNLKRILQGRTAELFYLKPSDIVYVPEKFSWF
jgi:polysaccharide export outer membrane protein